MKKLLIVSMIILISISGFSCAKNINPNTYRPSDAGRVQSSNSGTVIDVRVVQIEGNRSGLGTAAGAGAGGLGGAALARSGSNSIGKSAIGIIGGALVGGLIGTLAEEGLTRQEGYEYQVRMDDGRVITLVQGGELINVGTAVWVTQGGEQSRITRMR
jgi:outer membrane lipoprotein SlyB